MWLDLETVGCAVSSLVLAAGILHVLMDVMRRPPPPRPSAAVVLIEGLIGAGKSTYIARVIDAAPADVHMCASYEYVGTAFLAAFYANPAKYGFALQMTQHAHRIAALRGAAIATHTTLLDRSVLGDYAFALWNAAIGNLSPADWALYQEAAGESVTAALDALFMNDCERVRIVYLHDNVLSCHERQQARDGTAVDRAYMLGLDAAHLVVMALAAERYTRRRCARVREKRC